MGLDMLACGPRFSYLRVHLKCSVYGIEGFLYDLMLDGKSKRFLFGLG